MLATWGTSTGRNPTLDLQFAGATSLDNRITFTRASTATYFDQLGVLQSASTDVARFDYDPSTLAPLGLLIEEQRTNSIRNNTMQGAVAGTPGTLPTNWLYGQVSTLTTEIVGTGTEAGVAYVDVRISGTLTGSPLVYFESNSTVVATDAQTWATSFFVKLVGGSTTNISSVAVRLRMSDSGGTNLGFLTGSAITLPTSSTSLSACRFSAALTTTNASTAFVMPALTFSATGAIDITLRIGLPQLELGAFVTSVIPTTTTALTRSADVASMTGTNFSSWFNAAEGTVYAEATTRIPYTGTNLFPRICEINDSGLTTNAIRMLYGVKSAETDYIGSVSVSGVAQYSSDSGESNGGRQIIAYKTDDFSAASNGTLLATDTSGTLPVVNTLFLGSYTMSGVGNINGTIKKIAYYPVRLPNSTLQALTA